MFSPVYNARIQWDRELVVKSLEILSEGIRKRGRHAECVRQVIVYIGQPLLQRDPVALPFSKANRSWQQKGKLVHFYF